MMKTAIRYRIVSDFWEYRLAVFLTLGLVFSSTLAVALAVKATPTAEPLSEGMSRSYGSGEISWPLKKAVIDRRSKPVSKNTLCGADGHTCTMQPPVCTQQSCAQKSVIEKAVAEQLETLCSIQAGT